MNIEGKNIFFLGKGGTGKTTLAALTASALADQGKTVVLISMDPAHNLYDVFHITSSKKSVRLNKNLVIEEIDIDYWIRTYLIAIEQQISKSYQYLTALSLEKNIQIIRYSPGLEEYALIYAYEEMEKKYNQYLYRIFDMPPTALALRFFNLPQLTLVWLKQLTSLRKNILEKRKIIENIHKDTDRIKIDKVLNQLYHLEKKYEDISHSFKNKQRTKIQTVLNEDDLSISESKDIVKQLSYLGFHIDRLLINKYQNIIKKNAFDNLFDQEEIYFFPFSTIPLIGLDTINKYINTRIFKEYIKIYQD